MAKTIESQVSHLKNCLDALEKLKAVRREIKQRLTREGLRDDEEISLADDLAKISRQVDTLEKAKLNAMEP